MRLTNKLFVVALAISSLNWVKTASADWNETASASGGSALDLDWTFNAINALGGATTPTTTGAVGGVMQITDTTPASLLGTAAAAGLVTSESFTDVRVTATINPNGANDMNNYVGVVARATATTGYALYYGFNDTNVDENSPIPQLLIGKFDGTNVETLIATDDLGLAADSSFYLDFLVVGSSLKGQLYDQPGGSLIAQLETTDVSYASGYSGVLVFINLELAGQSTNGTWDNISAVVIPEPNSAILATIGACAIGLRSRRRRQR